MAAPRYKFLRHTTDAYIQSIGSTFEEALENAGLALFDTMCNLKSISHRQIDDVEADGADKVELLYDWLDTLLLKFELEGKVYSKFDVNLQKRGHSDLHVRAKAFGESYERKLHGSKVEVKAVTYHNMEVVKQRNSILVRFILDL